jgi:protein-L-isoaspartate O-methyltransferase
VLCLASGGGQQAPVLAAAGAHVVSFDLSDEQLRKDRDVAERENLLLRCVRGDMADLSALASASFDLIFHPVANVFVPDINVVWRAQNGPATCYSGPSANTDASPARTPNAGAHIPTGSAIA